MQLYIKMPVVYKKRKVLRKRRVARKPLVARRRVRIPRPVRVARSGVPEYASLSVKRSLVGDQPLGTFGAQTLYNLMNTSLAQFPRAVQVAQAYQFFRIKRITLTFKPSYDTFQATLGGVSKPRLYWMIDKSGSIPTNVSLEGLKDMGARPIELDENPRIISWKPSVLTSVMDVAPVGNIPAQYKISPWLSTNNAPVQPGVFVPSGVDHLGLYWYLDMLNNPQGYLFQIESEIQFEFKKPLTDKLGEQIAIKAN